MVVRGREWTHSIAPYILSLTVFELFSWLQKEFPSDTDYAGYDDKYHSGSYRAVKMLLNVDAFELKCLE